MPVGFKLAAITPEGGVDICCHRLIKNNLKIFWNDKINFSGQWFRLIKPLVSSSKHLVRKVSCSNHLKSVMCHLLWTICCIQGFSGILSKTFSEHCSFYNIYNEIYHKQLKILLTLRVALEEVIFRGQHLNVWKKTAIFSKAVFNK